MLETNKLATKPNNILKILEKINNNLNMFEATMNNY